MPRGPSIREARPDEAEQIARVHVRSWQAAYRDQLPDEYLETLHSDLPRRTRMWATAITDGPVPLVAEVDGKIVGFVSYGPSRDLFAGQQVGEVYAIYLVFEQWGKGIGKALQDETITRLRSRGFSEATLWVLDTNQRTRRWYERQGWTADGSEKVAKVEGIPAKEIRYRISLQNRKEPD